MVFLYRWRIHAMRRLENTAMGEYVTSEDKLDVGDREARIPEPRGVTPAATGSNFSSTTCDIVNGSASGAPLLPGTGLLAINGNADLSRCVVGNSNAKTFQVYLIRQQNFKLYEYLLWIYAQGPEGAGSGNMWLRFEDETHDHYLLKVHSSTLKWHFLQYNSKSPGIIKLEWSDSKP
jgi:hypothetical protein